MSDEELIKYIVDIHATAGTKWSRSLSKQTKESLSSFDLEALAKAVTHASTDFIRASVEELTAREEGAT